MISASRGLLKDSAGIQINTNIFRLDTIIIIIIFITLV